MPTRIVRYFLDLQWPWKLLQYSKSLPLKDAGLKDGNDNTLPMTAGTRYNLALQFKGRSVDLTLTAMEWKMERECIGDGKWISKNWTF